MIYFTDGSRIKAPYVTQQEYFHGLGVLIGWGAVDKNGKVLVQKAQFGGSNINAELFAIRDLLKYIDNNDIDKNVLIETDSDTSMKIINICLQMSKEDYMEGKPYNKLKKNEQIALDIVDLMKKRNVSFMHIRGHNRGTNMTEEQIIGNANADNAATTASNELYNWYNDHERELEIDKQDYQDNRFRLGYVH